MIMKCGMATDHRRSRSLFIRATALLAAVALLLCGCRTLDDKNVSSMPEIGTEKVSGLWLSFSEINTMLKTGDFKTAFATALKQCDTLKITDLFVHVRAYCDSLYPSDYFPMISAAAGYDYDILEYIISSSHQMGIRVHAWINPYRVRTADENIDQLPQNSPAFRWLHDDNKDNDVNVCFSQGVYLNPCCYEVRQLVIGGIRELLSKYKVDGIHFDDYFYPTNEPSFDESSYQSYAAACDQPLSQEDWRRANVNTLISGCYTAIKFINRKLIFSVSPAASIEKNRTDLYADVKAWIDSGCIDWIIPQLYFGFEYPQEKFRFDTLLNEWNTLAKGKAAKLLIGLAAYKVGTQTVADAPEWNSCDDLLTRQVKLCENTKGVSGYVFFSYTALFSEQELNKKERENLLAAGDSVTEKKAADDNNIKND